jgi:SAM-dependent methyltransferase
MTYWDSLQHHTDTSEIWMAHPLVRAAINRRVTGDPNVWPLPALLNGRHFRTGLSIGCGTGGLERSLAGIVAEMTGIDSSEPALEEARRLGPGIRYIAADAWSFLPGKTYDAIFFHQSLHHFDRLDELMMLVRNALAPGGMLYIDEYIGPSRNEWNFSRLFGPNLVYRMLPSGTRRAKIVRAPINREDPTEAIRSSQIVSAVEDHFTIETRRNYGGHLLSLLYPNMKRGAARFDEAVAHMIRAEEGTLDQSFYAVIIASRTS